MNPQTNSRINLLLRSLGELVAVTLLVFATGWGGVRLAERVHRHPVSAGRGGIVELRIVKSDRHGDVSFEEGPGYVGWWHCRGKEWAVEWRFAPNSARHYRIEVRLASPERLAGEKIEVAIRDQKGGNRWLRMQQVVPDTGGPENWMTLQMGEVQLEATPYTLAVRPGSPGSTSLNVKSVTIRPVESR
jgi:hypothetical protein